MCVLNYTGFPTLDADTELDHHNKITTLEFHAVYDLLEYNFFSCCASS